MLRLFKYEGFKMTIEPEVLLLKPFKKIWDKDKSKNKEKAFMDLGFIYFFSDPRSDYQYITDEEDRIEAIKEGEGLPKEWTIYKELQEAIDYYNTFNPTSHLLLKDTRLAVDKLRILLRNIDLNQTDDKGRPVYTLNTIVSTINQVPILVKNLDEAEKTLAKEMIQNDKIRGSAEKSMYEDL